MKKIFIFVFLINLIKASSHEGILWAKKVDDKLEFINIGDFITNIRFDVTRQDDDGDTILHLLIENNAEELVKKVFYQGGFDINQQNNYGDTPLHCAVYSNQIEVVKMFLTHQDINPNIQEGTEGVTPLHYASFSGFFKIAQLLLARKDVDRNSQNFEGATPLHLAVYQCCNEIVKILLQDPNIDINIRDNEGKVASDYASDPILGLFLYHSENKK